MRIQSSSYYLIFNLYESELMSLQIFQPSLYYFLRFHSFINLYFIRFLGILETQNQNQRDNSLFCVKIVITLRIPLLYFYFLLFYFLQSVFISYYCAMPASTIFGHLSSHISINFRIPSPSHIVIVVEYCFNNWRLRLPTDLFSEGCFFLSLNLLCNRDLLLCYVL